VGGAQMIDDATFEATARARLARGLVSNVARALEALDVRDIVEVAHVVEECVLANRQVFLLGNGGSCATASHLANDLVLAASAAALPARVLSPYDNSALVSALANDLGFEASGEVLIETHAGEGDVLIVFSGSGRSENLVRAAHTAQKRGLTSVLIGSVAAPDDFPATHRLLVDSDHYSAIEAVHLALTHVLTDLFRDRINAGLARCSDRHPRSR
jgi:D-sedoheptulose 7-phosphate isomerase